MNRSVIGLLKRSHVDIDATGDAKELETAEDNLNLKQRRASRGLTA
jgi:hypothetical protein